MHGHVLCVDRKRKNRERVKNRLIFMHSSFFQSVILNQAFVRMGLSDVTKELLKLKAEVSGKVT